MGADHVHWHNLSSRKTPLELIYKPFQTPPPSPDTAPMIHKVQKGSVKQFLSMGADHVHWHDLSLRMTPQEINNKPFHTQLPPLQTQHQRLKKSRNSIWNIFHGGWPCDLSYLSWSKTPEEIDYNHFPASWTLQTHCSWHRCLPRNSSKPQKLQALGQCWINCRQIWQASTPLAFTIFHQSPLPLPVKKIKKL